MCVSPFLGQKYTSVLKDFFFRRRKSKGETREIVSKTCSARFRRVRTELSVLSVRTFPPTPKKRSALSPLIPRHPPTLSLHSLRHTFVVYQVSSVLVTGIRNVPLETAVHSSSRIPSSTPLYYDTQCLPSPPRQRPRAAAPRAKPPVLRPRTTRAFRPLRMPTSNSRPWGRVRPSAQSPWGRISCSWLELERLVRCRICLRPRN
jgi:hypothetical protein